MLYHNECLIFKIFIISIVHCIILLLRSLNFHVEYIEYFLLL